MKRLAWLGLLVAVLGLAGCKPQPVTPPAGPVVDEAGQRREEFFGAEARDPAIVWRPSGLGVKILVPGEGIAPTAMDRVHVQYIGRLKDGKIFDDSRKRNKPSIFAVNRLITGWAAAMPSLKPGGKAVFYIPPSLGYGGMRSGDIPPVSGLIFEVELLEVNPASPEKS
jgi:FKBP-type peptidyl-prolyl cis-trans isomerase FklB